MNEAKTFLEPLAGLLLDEISKLRNRPFVPHSLTKLRNLKMCRDLAGGSTAVEIGTYKGVTTKRLSKIFDHVVSVEIDAELHRQASERLKGCNNVRLVLGDGARALADISKEVEKAVLFLDGHFSGGDTGIVRAGRGRFSGHAGLSAIGIWDCSGPRTHSTQPWRRKPRLCRDI